MKKELFILAAMPLLFSSCLTHIVTVAPTPIKVTSSVIPVTTYTTTVTTPKVKTVTTTRVTPIGEDISLYLDLQAVAAAFAQSATVQEFEQLLNNSSYMLSNLDLNGDGYVDYLRVVETLSGYNHIFLIQAVLAANIYQDVATLVAEVPSVTKAYVQVIGAPYIYGPNYIIQPTYIATPLIFTHLRIYNYRPWVSPWYWGHFPTVYRHPAPIYLSHYQAYVTTYMSNHHYCKVVTYPTVCHYPDYARISQPMQRNDYGAQHPERSFTSRNANAATSPRQTTPAASTTRTAATISSAAPARAANASDVRARQAENVTSTSTPTRTATSASASTTRSSSASTSTSRTAGSSSSATARTSIANTTTVTSKVRTSGVATTRTTPAPAQSSSSARSAATSTSTPRSTSTNTTPRSSSTSQSTPRSTGTSTSTRNAATSSSARR